MPLAFSELVNLRYRTLFHPEKTGKAFGYWKNEVLGKRFYELSQVADYPSNAVEQLAQVLMQIVRGSTFQRHEKMLRAMCTCSCFHVSSGEFEENYRSFISLLEEEDVSDIDNLALERIIYILVSQGLFRAALLLREKFEAKVLKYGSASEKMSVFFQNGDFTSAHSLFCSSPYFSVLRFLSPRAYTTYKRTIEAVVSPKNADHQSEFSRYISARPVYIIGPSDNHCPTVLQDDCVVIRYAYMGKQRLTGCYAERQTNISYYNGMHASSVAAMPDTSFLDDLRFAVLKYRIKSSFWQRRLDNHHLRISPVSLSVMQHGVSPNMLQIVLVDLMQFGKIDLTVLNNNLYLNRFYEEGYASVEVQKKQDNYAFAAQFAKHDVFCNFKFTKALFEQGFFQADARLKAILSMTNEEFADAMEREYGHQNYITGGEK